MTFDMALVAGCASGAVIFAAFLMVSMFRAAVLLASALFLTWTYSQSGVSGIMNVAEVVRAQAIAQPVFSMSLLAGMLAVLILALVVISLRK